MARARTVAIVAILSLLVGALLGAAAQTGGPATYTVTATTTAPGTTATRLVEVTRTQTSLATVTLPPSTVTLWRTTSATLATTAWQITTRFETVTLRGGPVEEVCFSRAERCDELLVSLIELAVDRIYVAVYVFTRDQLADALIRARERGVEVKVLIESANAYDSGSDYLRLRNAGVDVRLDRNSALMHHKFMVIDGEIVVTGSYNWSAAAEERNDENVVVIRDAAVAGEFEREFMRMWGLAG